MDQTSDNFIWQLGMDAARFLSAYQFATRGLRTMQGKRERVRGGVHGFAQAQEQVLTACNTFLQEQDPMSPPVVVMDWDPTDAAHAFMNQFMKR